MQDWQVVKSVQRRQVVGHREQVIVALSGNVPEEHCVELTQILFSRKVWEIDEQLVQLVLVVEHTRQVRSQARHSRLPAVDVTEKVPSGQRDELWHVPLVTKR